MNLIILRTYRLPNFNWTFLFKGNRRYHILLLTLFLIIMICSLFIAAHFVLDEASLKTHFLKRNMAPCLEHPFGTDWLGRDMLTRTIKGLSLSLGIGMTAAFFSTVISLFVGVAAATLGKKVDAMVTVAIDCVMGIPHLVLLILISFCVGGGVKGVIIAVGLTHWTRLARIIRSETLQIQSADYIHLSYQMGKRPIWIACHHVFPGIFPHFIVGLILLFPHAIMHAAGLTFLGFGISPHTPAIGVLLSESMKYLSAGYYWLAVFPGIALIVFVKFFDMLGSCVRYLSDPETSQE